MRIPVEFILSQWTRRGRLLCKRLALEEDTANCIKRFTLILFSHTRRRTKQHIIVEPKVFVFLTGAAVHVHLQKAAIKRVITRCHLFCVIKTISFPVTELIIITTRIIVLDDVVFLQDHLTHLINEKGLSGREQAQDCRGLQPLPRYKLLQVHLPNDLPLRLLHEQSISL